MTTRTIKEKTVKIELSGGFHNSGTLTMRVPLSKWEEYDGENSSLGKFDLLSQSQYKRADKFFCGIKNCTCGGVQRADITLID